MRIVASLVLPAALLTAQSQFRWTELTLATRPFARERLAMAYDGARNQTVLFGGFNGGFMNDTWTLDLGGWQRRTPALNPPARADHAMAYDPLRQRVVLLGGTNGSPLSDLWEWNGTSWTQRAAAVPGVAEEGAACYDPLQGGVFYNRGSVNLLWDGTSASPVTVANPSAGQQHQLVFDAASGGVLAMLGGGTHFFRQPQGWTQVNYTNLFSRSRYAMAFDPRQNRPVLQGGDGSAGNSSGLAFPDTWAWNGTFWTLLVPGAYGRDDRSRHGMVFDAQRGALLVFGGLRNGGGYRDSTAILAETRAPAEYRVFGSGCAGNTGRTPALAPDLLWNSAPILGGVFFLRLEALPPSQPVVGLLGASDQSWNGVPLPLDLGAAGMAGCALLVAPELLSFLGASNAGGTASWPLPIPSEASLLGAVFFQQVAAVAPGANPAGVLWSNGGRGTIGVR